VLLEIVDEVTHRLLGDVRSVGEVGQSRSVGVDVLEDSGVRGADVCEAGVSKPDSDPLNDLVVEIAKQNPDVRALVA